MKKVEYYIAEDGAKFLNEQECFEYEEALMEKKFHSNLIFFDEEGMILTGSLKYRLEVAEYIYIRTVEALTLIHKIGEEKGLAAPKDLGLWEWNPISGVFQLAINKTKEKEDYLERYKRKWERFYEAIGSEFGT